MSDATKPRNSGVVNGAVPLPIADVVFHHLRQHAGAILGKISEGKCLVFYMELNEVTVEGDAVVSNGRGMFTGPLRTTTATERDMVVAALPGMPADFRASLNRTDCPCLVAVKIAEKGGVLHNLTVALGEADLQGLQQGTQEGAKS